MSQELLKRIAKALVKCKIPYMVIGGQAVLLYGLPRLTEDLDITLGVGVEKAEAIKNIFKEIGLIKPKNIDDDFIRSTFCLVGIDEKSGVRVDFIFSFTPYEKEAIKRAKQVIIGKTKVKFASIEDLIVHKMFAGRAKDLEDIRGIIDRNRDRVDFRLIRKILAGFVSLDGQTDIIQRFDSLVND